MFMIVYLGLELASFLWGIFRPLEGNLAVATLPTHDMIFPACGQSSDVEMKVKMESFNGLDILPGFSKQAAGDTAHDLMLINSSNSVDLSAKGHQASIYFLFFIYFVSA